MKTNAIKTEKIILPVLKKILGKDIELKKINVFRQRKNLLVVEYIVQKGKTKSSYIGKIRFDGKINTAKRQYINIKKINKLTKNGLATPKELFYIKKYKALIYRKVEGRQLSDIITKNKAITKEQLDEIINFLIRVQKNKFGSSFILNKKFRPQYIMKEVIKNSSLSPKNKEQIISLTNKTKLFINTYATKSKTLCHNDLQPENILFLKNKKATAIDFDNSIVFDPIIDLSNLITQIRYGGLYPLKIARQYRVYLIDQYTKKTADKENITERINVFLAYASLKNLNLHLIQKDKKYIEKDIAKINKVLSKIHVRHY